MESATTSHSINGDDISNGASLSYPNNNPNPNLNFDHHITITPQSPEPSSSAPNPNESPSTSPISATIPPYWQQSQARPLSYVSIDSIHPSGITLQDNTADGDEEGDANGRDKNEACWARSVVIEDYVVVNGSGIGGMAKMGKGLGIGGGIGGGIGAFVVWNVRVDTLEGTPIIIRKRYSEFTDLRTKLLRTFPNSTTTIPELPRKSVISKFRPKFLENRRSGLQYFLNCILLNPEFSSSPVLKEFLFS
ncbi:681c12d5-9941-4553-b8b0-a262f3ceb2f8 [Sclerotinia trifoliorum]|uniref:Endosomal/vacuolar adapter protein YPT35 n=1 Tax=Sclerotinia trifoliorum TaxID=28548 RepID=A0A8H2VP00_9HELO|nr:681c12d5-9941-4553-b8b0-a262f3ceb2f8 [Sclerotinia trifoliorum]